MNKDNLIWVVEYLIGIGFLVAVLPFIVNPQPGWSPAHGWAYLLFIVCAGIALISSASGTRQRIELSKRITELEKKLDEKSAQNRTQNTSGPQFISKEHLVGSVN
jgi:hypothetical protein